MRKLPRFYTLVVLVFIILVSSMIYFWNNSIHNKSYTVYAEETEEQTTKQNNSNISAVNVRAFGAKGNGVNDDTAAIQAAINASSNVYIPKGTYMISSPLVWSKKNGWSIIGDRGSTRLMAQENINILTPPEKSQGQFGTIQGIIFESKKLGQGTGIGGDTSSYIAHILIEQCEFKNSLRYGISGDLIECDIMFNKFGTVGISPEGHAFKAIRSIGVINGNESNVNRIKYNEILRCSDDYAVDIQNGNHLTFEGNTLENNQTQLGLILINNIRQSFFVRNWFERNGAVCTFKISGGLSRTINVIDGNHINLIDQSAPCVIDDANAANKNIVYKNNFVAGTKTIIKRNKASDQLDGLLEYSNNYVMDGDTSLSPDGTNTFGVQSLVATKSVVSGKFISDSVVISLKANALTTAKTLPSNESGMYIISALCDGKPASLFSACTIVAVGGASSRIIMSNDSKSLGIVISGLNIQVIQKSESAVKCRVSITRIG